MTLSNKIKYGMIAENAEITLTHKIQVCQNTCISELMSFHRLVTCKHLLAVLDFHYQNLTVICMYYVSAAVPSSTVAVTNVVKI